MQTLHALPFLFLFLLFSSAAAAQQVVANEQQVTMEPQIELAPGEVIFVNSDSPEQQPPYQHSKGKLTEHVLSKKLNVMPGGYGEDFEDGTYAEDWTIGSIGITAEIITTNPGEGNYSLQVTGERDHLFAYGMRNTYPSGQPTEISYLVKGVETAPGSCYVIAGPDGNYIDCIVFMYWSGNAWFFVNDNPNPDVLIGGAINQWTHFELKNIDWDEKHFDIYFNGDKKVDNFPFRGTSITSANTIELTNNFPSAMGIYDDIKIFTPAQNQPPVALCKPVTIQANENCVALAEGAHFDDGSYDPDGDPINFGLLPLVNSFPLGITEVTLFVDDQEDNSSCTTTLTVVDGTAPTISCPSNIVIPNNIGECGASVGYVYDASDNCGSTTVTQTGGLSSGSFFPVGTTLNSFLVVDGAQHSATCSFEVTIIDTEKPMLNCQVVNPNQNTDPGQCSYSVSGTEFDLGASDNCQVQSLSNDFNNSNTLAGATFDAGTTTVSWTATDLAGNTAECSIDIVITDNEKPVITTCAGQIMVFNGEEEFLTEDYIDFAASDNCAIESVSYDPEIISCDQLGEEVPVTVTVTDIYGNAESCTTSIVVDGLPCGFVHTQLGCDGDADYEVSTETFSLESTNCVYNSPFNQDKGTFVQTELCGNGEIIAEISNLVSYGWAGIMMRESLDAGSKKMALSRDNGTFARREIRTTTNAYAFPQQFPAFGKNWLKLVRNGNQFVGYVSPNGVQWQMVMVSNINMNDCIHAGLFLTNKQPNTTITTDFRNVEVNPASGNALQQLPDPTVDVIHEDVNVYPNPSAGQVTINLGALRDQATGIQLRNTTGQVLRHLDLAEESDRYIELQLDDLPVGIYWLQLQVIDAAVITKRIVIHR